VNNQNIAPTEEIVLAAERCAEAYREYDKVRQARREGKVSREEDLAAWNKRRAGLLKV
jgi:hypothetical protein